MRTGKVTTLRPRVGVSPLRGLVLGAAAGAAGTTALNAVTYLDMAIRGRPASATPEDSVKEAASKAHIKIGEGEVRQNRVEGLAPLTGIAAGVGTGALLGLARALGWQPSLAVATVFAGIGAMAAGNGPMAALGVTDPRTWAAKDWVADAVPHLAYGAVVAWVVGMCNPSTP